MAAAELETVVRLGLPMVVVVYDDRGYGAEVHHFPAPTTRPSPSPRSTSRPSGGGTASRR